MIDPESVQSLISAATNRKFVLKKDIDGWLDVPKERIRWFFHANDLTGENQTPFVHVFWIDTDDVIHIDTKVLGDTMDMVEWIYGGIPADVTDMDYSGIGKKGEVWEKVKVRFPPVINRLVRYEYGVSQLSKEHHVPLEMVYFGRRSLASFHIEARIETKQLSGTKVAEAIEGALSALKDAYYKIEQHQKSLYWAWGNLPSMPVFPEESRSEKS